jgi:hypothetical protein
MFSSMLYKGFKAGEKMFHLFTDNSLVNPADYESLAVEMIKFAGELKVAIKAQEDAAVATPKEGIAEASTNEASAQPQVPSSETPQP